jgi:8-oxo-dGTP pyrophosphatase MutT (NUDIX family)
MTKPRRNARQRKRIKWLAKSIACRPAVGTEQECEGVLLTRAKRVPPDYWAENNHQVRGILRKRNRRRGFRGWDLLLPGGGVHEFKTKHAACRFFARLAPLPVDVPHVATPEEE